MELGAHSCDTRGTTSAGEIDTMISSGPIRSTGQCCSPESTSHDRDRMACGMQKSFAPPTLVVCEMFSLTCVAESSWPISIPLLFQTIDRMLCGRLDAALAEQCLREREHGGASHR